MDSMAIDDVATADWVFDEDAVPVCSHCLEPVGPMDHYCARCDMAVGQWTGYLPWVNIPYMARFFGELWERIWWRRGVSWLRRVIYFTVIALLAGPMLLAIPFVLWRKIRSALSDPEPGRD